MRVPTHPLARLVLTLFVMSLITAGATAAMMAVSGSSASSLSPQFRGHPPISSGFDEQIGLTFTQNFTSISYNVTAVEQTDPTLGTGPGYLVSGLTNTSYWYQVGLSWDWSPGAGFAMSYEVFNPEGQSVFPVNGGGGLASFSGPINPGDNVTLSLYFSSGSVVMAARDTSTGASAQETYSAQGGGLFVGEPNSDANSIGFFTGLMTEWYHGEPYYNNEAEVLYTTVTPITSAWMWMDEFNADNGQLVFASNATTISSYGSDPSQLQEFSYSGITEYSSAGAFVTGALSTSSSGTGNSTSTVTSTDTVTSTVTSAVGAGTTATETVTTTVPTTVTVTSTSTSTVTTTTPSTTTVTTQPPTVTDTTTSTSPPTTQTVTDTTTSTATQTLTASSFAGLPLWAYLLMGIVLVVGLALGYLSRRTSPAATENQPPSAW